MPNFADYYYLKISSVVNIGIGSDKGGMDFATSGFELIYEIDQIPSARIDLPIGRQVSGSAVGKVVSTANIFSDLPPFTPVTLRMKIDVLDSRTVKKGKNVGFPIGQYFNVFEGYFSAPLHIKSSSGTATLTIQCFGATAALAGATQYNNGAVIVSYPNSNTFAAQRIGSRAQEAHTLNDAIQHHSGGNIASNLWAAGMLPLLEQCIESVNLWTSSITPALEQATAALDRINKNQILPLAVLPIVNAGPASFQAEFQKSLAAQLTNGFYSLWRDGSDTADLWDVIQSMGQYFLYHFVPGVSEDAVAPVTPNLGGEEFVTIDPSEYSSLNLNGVYSPKFYAYQSVVGLYSKAFTTGAYQTTAAPSQIIGKASIDAIIGKTKIIEAPNWLLPPPAPAKRSLWSFFTGGPNPDKANARNAPAPPADKIQGAIETGYLQSGIGNNYAEAILHEELFLHRKLAFDGRLRFDIAPGSLIKLNTVGEAFTGQQETLYGCLNRVRISVGSGASGSHAKTTLELTHIRTQDDHNRFTTPFHPIFRSEAWVGGPLAGGSNDVE